MRKLVWLMLGSIVILIFASQLPAADPSPSRMSQTPAVTKSSWAFEPNPQVVSFTPIKGGFGTVLILEQITIKNPSEFPVSDFRLSCDVFGRSGTKIQTAETRLYERVEPQKTKTFQKINVGFMHSQAANVQCSAYHDWR